MVSGSGSETSSSSSVSSRISSIRRGVVVAAAVSSLRNRGQRKSWPYSNSGSGSSNSHF